MLLIFDGHFSKQAKQQKPFVRICSKNCAGLGVVMELTVEVGVLSMHEALGSKWCMYPVFI